MESCKVTSMAVVYGGLHCVRDPPLDEVVEHKSPSSPDTGMVELVQLLDDLFPEFHGDNDPVLLVDISVCRTRPEGRRLEKHEREEELMSFLMSGQSF